MKPSDNDKMLLADLLNAVGLTTALQARDRDARRIFDRAIRAAASLQQTTEAHVDAAAAHRKTMRTVRRTAAALHSTTRHRLISFQSALYSRTHDEVGVLLDEDRWLDGSWYIATYAPVGGVGRLARGGPKLQEQVQEICTGMVKALGEERIVAPLLPFLEEHRSARQQMSGSSQGLSKIRQDLKEARAEASAVCSGIRHYLSFKEILGDPDAVSPALALPRQTAHWKKQREARKEKAEEQKKADEASSTAAPTDRSS